METKAEADPVQQGADAHFGSRVLTPNAAHVPTSVFFCEGVSVHYESTQCDERIVQHGNVEPTERFCGRLAWRASVQVPTFRPMSQA